MGQPKIVVFDLETLPNLKEALKVWPQLSQYPGKTLRATITSIICIGWKYAGGSKTECINAWDFSRWKRDVNDDYSVVRAFYEIIKNADAIVTQNGKRFDWKFLQTRLIIHGFPPLHNIPHIDTKALASKHMYLFNNRLNTLGEFLVGDKKLENGGWDLWVKVHQKDKQAMDLMTRYCVQDVKLLDKVFEKLRPLAKNIPNFNNWTEGEVCPYCGSENIYRNGWHYTKTKVYQRVVCKDCGGNSRVDKRDSNVRSV